MNWGTKRTEGGAEKKREKTKNSLLAEGEKCAKITDLFSSISPGGCAASASNANMSLEVSSDTDIQGELDQEGEDKGDGEGSKHEDEVSESHLDIGLVAETEDEQQRVMGSGLELKKLKK